METKQLLTFITLAETLNYPRAAERLQYAPSSLHRHIELLEEELGAPLFDKAGKRLVLTEEGRRLLPEADEHFYCVYASRKDGHAYTRTHEEIMARYGSAMVMQEEMPPMNWPQMGRYMYTAKLRTFEEAQAFICCVQG